MKLLTNGYKYKPNEENQIKQEFKKYLKLTLNEVGQNWKFTLYYTRDHMLSAIFGEELLQKDAYYFIDTIHSTNFTLSNVTIKGLWNFESILLDFTNSTAAFPQIQISDVSGTLVQTFHSTGVEKSLGLNVDKFYISGNREAASVNIKAEGCSIKNIKYDTLLMDNPSKLIIEM